MFRFFYIILISLVFLGTVKAQQVYTPADEDCVKKQLISILIADDYTPVHAKAMVERCCEIKRLAVPSLGPLSQQIVRVTYCAQRPSTSFLFFVNDNGTCLPLAGDFNNFFKIPWTHEEQRQLFISNFNLAVINFPQPIRDDQKIIEYVSSVIALLYPSATIRVINNSEEIWTNSDKKYFPKKRWLNKKVAKAIRPPAVSRVDDTLFQGLFFVWSNIGGWLEQVKFFYWTDGRVFFQEDVLVTKVGPFEHEFLGRM